ncbi:MAG: nucleoside kinase [Bacilli bacterium]
MDKMIKVSFRGKEIKEFLEETTLLEISHNYLKYYNYPIIAAKVDNDITELSDKIFKKCNIDFYDRSSAIGNSIYGRSLQFLLIVATKKILGNSVDVIIEHSMDKGFYCEINDAKIDKVILKKIEVKMQELAKQNLLFNKVSVSRSDAVKYFKKRNQMDKVKVLKYISNSYVNLYRLEDIYDYFYGELAYSTGAINDFKLNYIKDSGFVVCYPSIYNPECTLEYVHRSRLFDKFLDYTNWGKMLGISNAADLNDIITTGKYDELIRISEAYSNNQLIKIADEIKENKKSIKLILIAGPTSSGKTTTSKKLDIFLKSKGVKTHQISIDDYFYDREKTPKNKNGEYDFESLKAIDVTLFNQDLMRLLAFEKVLLPEFNFVSGKREYKKKWLQINNEEVIIIEGLHALSDDLTLSIERNQKFKIYVSPLTQLNVDNHNRVHTSDTRRLRRIIRDNKFRGYNATDTLHMWKEIRESEEKNIFPFQDDADVIVNTALIYELGVLKAFAEPLLFSVDESDEEYPEAIRLINLLRNFLPIPSDDIPKDSVLREFIGNSCFK